MTGGARVRAIMRKEWADVRRNRTVLGACVTVPFLMTAIASAQLFIARGAASKMKPMDDATEMAKLPASLARIASNPRDAMWIMMGYIALTFFMVGPIAVPSIMAAHSIVGEKQARSLEPLLATPIRTWELVTGKLVAILIPGAAPALVGYAVYLGVAASVAPPSAFHVMSSAPWVLTVTLLGPLFAVTSVCTGIIVSSRANDVQTAQAVAGLVVLPVIGLGITQSFGAFIVSLGTVFAAAAVLVVIDVGLVLLCVSLFERETILSRWK